MSEHKATVRWKRSDEIFTDRKYSRNHTWSFDGGATILASAAPDVIRPPLTDPSRVDPEEGFVASISSCHMLWFLAIAAKYGFVVNQYQDEAHGILEKGEDRKMRMTRVTLAPRVEFSGEKRPSVEEMKKMHHDAHEQCYIANSVTSSVELSL